MSKRKKEKAQSWGVRKGTIVRLGLIVLATFSSVALAWLFQHAPQHAQASNITQVSTTKKPLGVALDGTNVWVAEPGCDVGITSTCSSAFPGIIGQYSQANPSGPHTDFPEPNGYSSPAFLALDGNGNIWFTEPTTDAIGELTPTGGGTWNQWGTSAGITAGSAPYNLAFDKNGNIWFTEGNRDAIGFFNTSTHQVVETAFKTGFDPDGMLADAAGTMWFALDNAGELGSFTPTNTGAITVSVAKIGQVNPQMLAKDAQGNFWYSEGKNVAIGEYNPATHAHADFSLTSVLCPTQPCPSGMYVGGIAVDSHGLVWFDEGKTGSVGFLDQGSKTITVEATVQSPSLGLIADANNTVWVTEKLAFKLAEIVSGVPTPTPTTGNGSPSPTPTGTPPPSLPPGPVNTTWYFAEGKVGQGFTEYLTIQNPDPVNTCTVSIQYLLSASTPAPKSLTVLPNTRWTEGVNNDLSTPASSTSYQAVATIVTVTNTSACKGVVVERPIYFTNFKGISGGTDALGATKLGNDFYFADVSTLTGYNSYITILNPPSGTAATITVTYYFASSIQGTDTLVVQPGTRGTIIPKSLNARAATWVHSDQPVVVERPTYFNNYSYGNAQNAYGSATVIGAPKPANDWRFAEGYTGGQFQENLVLANFGTTLANATVVLEYDNGSTLTNTYPINPQDNITLDVNFATDRTIGVCSPMPCALSQSVSAEITTNPGTNIVAEREMFFHFNHFDRALNRTTTAMGGTDDVGQSGAATNTSYSFSEGYTFNGYDEWLTVQNPTNNLETVGVTLINGKGTVYPFSISVLAHSRYTLNVDEKVVLQMYHTGDGTAGYQVSMTVQTTDGSAFVAERPMYWNVGGSQGGDDVIGYPGG